MTLVDRAEVLDRIDLAELATEICGEPVGRGRSTKWRCPNPAHPDQHPSMGLYESKQGHLRWKCHSCGEGGTAVDLLMISSKLTAGQALRELAACAGLHAIDNSAPSHPRRLAPAAVTTPRPARATASRPAGPVIEQFVAQAADLLWQPIGDGARRHLQRRGLTPPILRANRVGFDPGPRQLARPAGLPRFGPGIVYPVLDPTSGAATYYQVRYLGSTASTRKYDQPVTDVAANPTVAHIRNPTPPSPRTLVVCEGIPDALTAAHTGLAAVAVLGATHQPDALAAQLTQAPPGTVFLVAFDTDRTGTVAAYRLAAHLAQHGAVVARFAPAAPDLNAWWQADPTTLTHQLTATARMLSSLALPAADLAIAR
jgi:DNA primase